MVDIVKFVLEVFKNLEGGLKGKEVNIVGDEIIFEELMRLLSKVMGWEMRF